MRRKIAVALAPVDFGNALRFSRLAPQDVPEEPVQVHMLWIEGRLSQLEQLSCASFLDNGYDLTLWSYGTVSGVLDGAVLRDAREVLPEERVFRAHGGYASFSDLFRYAVLSSFGGLWSDTDVICLTPAAELQSRLPEGFLVTEYARDRRKRRINNNLIYHPAPRPGDIVDLAFAVADRFDLAKLKWADCGPKLLTALGKAYPALLPPVMEPNFANPLPPLESPVYLTAPANPLPRKASFLHCFNESWRELGIDKDAPWRPDSVLGGLQRRFGTA